eukprot:4622686-Pleurochrysis_carterae.AAC.1
MPRDDFGGGCIVAVRHDDFQPFVQRCVSVCFAGDRCEERHGAARSATVREPKLEVAQGVRGVGWAVVEREHGREG